jgi:hypothetical protein
MDYDFAYPGISSDDVYDAYDKFLSSLVSVSQVTASVTWRNYLVNSYHQGVVHDIVSLQEESIIEDSCSEKLFGMLQENQRWIRSRIERESSPHEQTRVTHR